MPHSDEPASPAKPHDCVMQLLESRNLAIRSLIPWERLYEELAQPSSLREQKAALSGVQYKASFKRGPRSSDPLTLRVKKNPDFTTKKYDYLTPSSFSLMPAYGKMLPYGSHNRILTGILVNIQECKKKSQIYSADGQTGSYLSRKWDVDQMTFWIQEAKKKIEKERPTPSPESTVDNPTSRIQKTRVKTEKERPPSSPIEPSLEVAIKEVIDNSDPYASGLASAISDQDRHIDLDTLRQITSENLTYRYNEILLSLQSKAIVGIFAYQTSSQGQAKNQYNLASKIDASYHQKKMANDYNINVPIYLLDPEKGLFLYSLEQQNEDIKSLQDLEVCDEHTEQFLLERTTKLSLDFRVKNKSPSSSGAVVDTIAQDYALAGNNDKQKKFHINSLLDIPNANQFSVLRANNLEIFSQQCA